MDERLYRSLIARMAKMQVDIFVSPPTSMEQFRERFGRWHELKLITDEMVEKAKGLEKD